MWWIRQVCAAASGSSDSERAGTGTHLLALLDGDLGHAGDGLQAQLLQSLARLLLVAVLLAAAVCALLTLLVLAVIGLLELCSTMLSDANLI
jgi:hypothetical protein